MEVRLQLRKHRLEHRLGLLGRGLARLEVAAASNERPDRPHDEKSEQDDREYRKPAVFLHPAPSFESLQTLAEPAFHGLDRLARCRIGAARLRHVRRPPLPPTCGRQITVPAFTFRSVLRNAGDSSAVG
jgi:hypothetical protein